MHLTRIAVGAQEDDLPRLSTIEAAVTAAGGRLAGVLVFDVRRAIAPDPDRDSLFIGLADGAAVSLLRRALEAHYTSQHAVAAVSRAGSPRQQVMWLTIATLDRAGEMPPPVSIFVPAPAPEQRATIAGLRAVMGRLRSEDGCPWDREQDHRSLRRCLLEEAHEALDAIDREDWQELAAELGDLLLQVLFHAQLAAERGEFDLDEVMARLRQKLVARHPHVFGDAVAEDAEAVLRRWEELKGHERREAGGEQPHDLLAGVAPTLPALERAQKVQRRAAHSGFDWPSVEGPLAKLAEEIQELTIVLAQAQPGPQRLEDELGDLLFAVVNVARFAGVDAEQALRTAVDRFAARFRVMERLAAEQGKTLRVMNLDEMDALWERAKEMES